MAIVDFPLAGGATNKIISGLVKISDFLVHYVAATSTLPSHNQSYQTKTNKQILMKIIITLVMDISCLLVLVAVYHWKFIIQFPLKYHIHLFSNVHFINLT